MIVLGGGFLLPLSRVPEVCPWVGMVLDEIDTCITTSICVYDMTVQKDKTIGLKKPETRDKG